MESGASLQDYSIMAWGKIFWNKSSDFLLLNSLLQERLGRRHHHYHHHHHHHHYHRLNSGNKEGTLQNQKWQEAEEAEAGEEEGEETEEGKAAVIAAWRNL